MVPFESLGMVSYLSTIVTVPFSSSLEMVPFESLGMVSYLSAIVTVALSCTVLELFDVE